MKTILSFIKILASLLVVVGITASCKKNECCTWTDNFGDTYMYCDDDNDWRAYYSTWQEVRDEAALYGGKCK